MNKFKLSLIALSCSVFLAACSSSSGGTDNSEQIRQTETTLTKKLVELNQQVKDAQQQAQNNQSSYNTAKAQADKAQAEVTTLTAQLANITKELAELKTKQAQAILEQKTSQLENAKQNEANQNSLKNLESQAQKTTEELVKAKQDLDKAQKEAESNKAESSKLSAEQQQKLKELDEQAKKAAEELAKAQQGLSKAQQDVELANKATEALKEQQARAEAERKVAEERLKQLENLSADEKARIPVNDQIFGGRTGVMTDRIAGAVFADVKSKNVKIGLPLSNDITKLHIVDEGKFTEIKGLVKKAGEEDPESFEAYEDPYNLRKDRQTIQSNSNLKSTAFGVYVDNLTSKQYLYVQGNPTDVKEIPKAGKAEYLGGAVYLKDGAYNERAKMTATVDFGKNTVAIKIDQKQDAVPEMNFGGKITGNSFAGEVNGVKTQGGFFGENAKELSGVFTNDADKSRGVFGAIKQDAAQ
ncbi:transferrin-binding protein-like solute binding protein [Haemophilus parahaemolyticus]|uniref:transferrin-binding protein-like solute binding protein n=1 Tax=Haemophilus parahaemolyticus TaxID=735 RepID=UPI0028E5C8B3|nr:transferrin-binding protein-like solute binding protein [Haemophilus parahaemolyticus]